MPQPKMMFYNDGRHPLIYQYEPPMSKEEYESAVDELVGTPVEALMFCIGDGRTQLYDTKVGELWGHNRDVWTHAVFHRAHRNAVALIEGGHDPLKVIIDRANEKGLLLYPTLLVQVASGDRETDVRGSDFRFDNKQFDIGAAGDLDPNWPHYDYADFKHEEIRAERLSIVKEVVENYDVDGFELNLNYHPLYFHPNEVDAGRPLMTEWIREAYELVKASGSDRELVVRVPASVDGCNSIGLDVREWIDQGIVDVVVGNTFQGPEIVDPMTDYGPLVEAAQRTNVRVIAGIHSLVSSDRMRHGSVEVLRGVATNYWAQGVDGLYVAYWHGMWPYSDDFYAKLRELPHPDVMATKSKVYYVPTQADRVEPDGLEPGLVMHLPAAMELNEPVSVDIRISDDLPRWGDAGRVDEVLLRIRVIDSTELDQYTVKLNGIELPDSLCRTINTQYGKTSRYGKPRAYFYIYRLDREHWPVRGMNTVEVTLVERDSDAAPGRVLHDVEIETRYLMGKRFYRDVEDPDLGPYT